MKHLFTTSLALLLVATLLPGCATIVSKKAWPVTITTKQPGASVLITDKTGREVYKGVSPATVTLKSGAGYFKKANYVVKLSSPGYPDRTIPIETKVNGWYFGNIALGGLLGLVIIDPLTGAMWKFKNPIILEDFEQQFTPLTTSAVSPKETKQK